MPDAKDIAVSIDRNGNTFAVRVELEVEATPEEVFAVLTDYDHMARFVSNVLESRTVRRDGDRLAVEQKSRLAVGPVHFDFTNVREIDLVPFREIRSRQRSLHAAPGRGSTIEAPSFQTGGLLRSSETWCSKPRLASNSRSSGRRSFAAKRPPFQRDSAIPEVD
jgi:hypothetical protein